MASRIPPKARGYSQDGKMFTRPYKRTDGEMYSRPNPDPFHPDWLDGYDDGLALTPHWKEIKSKPDYYADGYKSGVEERAALDNLGDSNT